MEATRSSETSVLTKPTRCHIPKHSILHEHSRSKVLDIRKQNEIFLENGSDILSSNHLGSFVLRSLTTKAKATFTLASMCSVRPSASRRLHLVYLLTMDPSLTVMAYIIDIVVIPVTNAWHNLLSGGLGQQVRPK
jgi:hypothetical protein